MSLQPEGRGRAPSLEVVEGAARLGKHGDHVGRRARGLEAALDERNLKVAIKNIARTCGHEISDAQPILDARLEDRSRVAAMFPPCSVNGPTLASRTPPRSPVAAPHHVGLLTRSLRSVATARQPIHSSTDSAANNE